MALDPTTANYQLAEVTTAIALPSPDEARTQLERVREFQRTVRDLFVEGHDFGKIPGTSENTLLKPGAEKLAKLLGLADTYDFVTSDEQWDRGFFNYTIRCRLISMATGQAVAEGLGNCNTWEAKYRYRWVWERDVPQAIPKEALPRRSTRNGGTQYRIENDDVFALVNTVVKMAKKRALVDAALSAGRLSDVFTQDLDDGIVEARSRELSPEPTSRAERPSGAPDKPWVVSEDSPWWQRWQAVCAEAIALGMPAPALALPIQQDDLAAAGRGLREAIERRVADQRAADTALGATIEAARDEESPDEATPAWIDARDEYLGLLVQARQRGIGDDEFEAPDERTTLTQLRGAVELLRERLGRG